MIWTKERLEKWVFGSNEEAMEVEEEVDKETNNLANLVKELTSHMIEEEFDCPIHGRLGGILEDEK